MSEVNAATEKTKADLIKERLNHLRHLASQIKEKAFLLTYLPAKPTAKEVPTKECSNFNEEVLHAISYAQEDLEDVLAVLNDFI